MSIDVFDTLLFRACAHPSDVFSLAGQKAKALDQLPPGQTVDAFKQIRILAESRARSDLRTGGNRAEEVRLDEIYRHFPAPGNRDPSLPRLEQAAEKELGFLNPAIMSLIEDCLARDIPVILLSDTYHLSGSLRNILTTVGFPPHWPVEIICSADHRKRKSSGRLFDLVKTHYPDASPSTFLHIGDHPLSDVQVPRERGFNVIHYAISPYAFTLLQWEELRHGVLTPEIRSLRLLAASLSGNLSGWQKTAFELGAMVIAPMVSAFAEWVVDICIKENRQRVLGLMREGGLLAHLVAKAARKRGVELMVSDFHVSRHSVVLATLQWIDKAAIDLLVHRFGVRIGTVGELLELFDIPPGPLVEHIDVSLKESSQRSYTDYCHIQQAVSDYLLQPDNRQRIKQASWKRRTLFTRYVTQETTGTDGIVTLDIGYRGTTQGLLDAYLGTDGERRGIHLVLFGAYPTRHLVAGGIDIRGYCGCLGEGRSAKWIEDISRWPWILELLLCGDAGTTLGYEENPRGEIAAITAQWHAEEYDSLVRAHCEQGILTYQQLWFDFCSRMQAHATDVVDSRDALCQMVHRLIDLPTREEVDLIGQMHMDPLYGEKTSRTVCNQKDLDLLQRQGAPGFHRHGLREANPLDLPWPQGVLMSSDPGYLIQFHSLFVSTRNHLVTMMTLANRVLHSDPQSVVIWGAGDVGKAFVQAAHFIGLRVDAIVDNNPRLHGGEIDGIPIRAFDADIWSRHQVYVVTSIAFCKEIEQMIHERYKNRPEQPTIFAPN